MRRASPASPVRDTPICFKANALKGRGQAVEEVGKVPDLGTKMMTETTSWPAILPDLGKRGVRNGEILMLGLQDVESGSHC